MSFTNVMGKTVKFDDHNQAGHWVALNTVLNKKVDAGRPRRGQVGRDRCRARPKRAAGSQSLERGLDVLEIVEAEGSEIGVREIARRLALSPTIVQRMVTSLAKRGYVDRDAETARYRLGYRALALGAHSTAPAPTTS